MDHILTADIDTCQYKSDTGSMTVRPVTIASSRELAEDTSPIDAVACCAPLQTAPLAADDAIGLASVLKAIADPARLRVISLLAANEITRSRAGSAIALSTEASPMASSA